MSVVLTLGHRKRPENVAKIQLTMSKIPLVKNVYNLQSVPAQTCTKYNFQVTDYLANLESNWLCKGSWIFDWPPWERVQYNRTFKIAKIIRNNLYWFLLIHDSLLRSATNADLQTRTSVSQTNTLVNQNSTSVRLFRLAISDGKGNTIFNLQVYICRTLSLLRVSPLNLQCGGQWSVGWTPDRVGWFDLSPAHCVVLLGMTHFTFQVPLFKQVYKWVLVKARGNPKTN